MDKWQSSVAVAFGLAALAAFGGGACGRGTKKGAADVCLLPLVCWGWRPPTLPGVNPVPSALPGLTALFGMGRGAHRGHSRHCLGTAVMRALMLFRHDMWGRDKQKSEERRAGTPYRDAPGQLVPLGCAISGSTPAAYRRRRLRRPFKGDLILGRVSHLDAFSAYPVRA